MNRNGYRNVFCKRALSVIALLVISQSSFADGFKFPSGLLTNTTPQPPTRAEIMQTSVLHKYSEASSYIAQAQLELARAFELKEQAAVLEAQANAFKSGATIDRDAIKKQRQISDSANAAIQAKMEAGGELSADGREHFINSLQPFTTGVILTKRLTPEAKTFSDTAELQFRNASGLDRVVLTTKLLPGVALATDVPGYTMGILGSFGKILTFAQQKNIPVPKDATDALGNL